MKKKINSNSSLIVDSWYSIKVMYYRLGIYWPNLGIGQWVLILTKVFILYIPEEIARQLENSKTTVIVTLPSLVELVNSAKKLIESRTKEEFKFTLITLKDSSTTNSSFEEMIDKRFDEYKLDVQIRGDDVAVLPYSSGTTGFPKGVQLTHSNLVHNLLQICTGDMKHVEESSSEYLNFYSIKSFSSNLIFSFCHQNGSNEYTYRSIW